MPRILDTYFVTVKVQATYTLHFPAEDAEEAIQSAYKSPILSERLYDIEKDVVKVVRMVETPKKVTLMAARI